MANRISIQSYLALGLITLLGGMLRLFQLNSGSIYFADEGAFLLDAQHFAQGKIIIPLASAKPLHPLFLSLGFLFNDANTLMVQRLVAAMATLWIPLIFFITRHLISEVWIALLASLFAAFDPYIYLSSQHLLAEPLAGLLWLVSLFFLLKRPLRNRDTILSALFFGLVILATRRMLLFGGGMVLFLLWTETGSWARRLGRVLSWTGICFIPPILFQLVHKMMVGGRGGPTDNYFFQLLNQLTHHAPSFQLKGVAWKTFPTLVIHYEGLFFVCLLLLGIFTLIKQGLHKKGLPLFLTTYLLSVLLFAFISLAHARLWSPFLFWHPILASLAFLTLSQWFQFFGKFRGAFLGMVALGLLASWTPRVLAIQRISVPYEKATTWLKENRSHGLVASIWGSHSLWYYFLQDQERRFKAVNITMPEEWTGLNKISAPIFLVLDPYRYTRGDSQSLGEGPHPLAEYVQKKCRPLLRLACDSPQEFWTHLAWEHNVSFSETQAFLKQPLSDLTCIEIYDVKDCEK